MIPWVNFLDFKTPSIWLLSEYVSINILWQVHDVWSDFLTRAPTSPWYRFNFKDAEFTFFNTTQQCSVPFCDIPWYILHGIPILFTSSSTWLCPFLCREEPPPHHCHIEEPRSFLDDKRTFSEDNRKWSKYINLMFYCFELPANPSLKRHLVWLFGREARKCEVRSWNSWSF